MVTFFFSLSIASPEKKPCANDTGLIHPFASAGHD
jgi:hypothetical protein